MMKKLVFAIVGLWILTASASAQEFEIKKYDINATVVPAEFKVDVQAKLRLVNLSDPRLADNILLSTSDRPRFSFYINPKAKVTAMKVNGAAATFKTAEDRSNLLRVSTDLTTSIASAQELDVEFVYSLPSADRNTSLHVSSGESYLLPGSFWVPIVHTPYAEHGADTAPMTITVNAPAGLKVVSSGIRKSESSFEQSLAAQPFFIVGDYDVVTRGGESHPVEVYVPRGLGEVGKQQAQRLATEAERMLAFYVKYFNAAAVAPFRVVATQARQLSTVTSDAFAVAREVAFMTAGLATVDDNLLRRDVLDLGTIELLAGAASRAWIDGQVLLRGRGTGMLRDALPVYLGGQYLGERYGAAQRDAAFDRYRGAYGIVARNDAPLLMQSQLDRNYTTSVYNKGAVIWRLLEYQVGKQNFENVLRNSLTRTKVDALSLSGWYSPAQGGKPAQVYPLCLLSRCANLKENLLAVSADRRLINEIFANWIDAVMLPDFAVGQPQTTANGVESTVANFGSGDVTIEVVATTDKGEKLRKTLTVKAGEYSAAAFPAGTNIATIEADPNKLYLQSDYTNDVFPRRPSDAEAFGQANLAFAKNDFAAAEAKAREGLKNAPNAPTLQALLGRALLAQKKTEEAAKVFDAVLKAEPLPLQAYGAANLGLAEIALQQNNFAEASRRFRFAAMSDFDAATTVAARDNAAKAERGANAVRIPEDIRAFLQKFDGAVLQSSADAVNQFIELGNLRKFAQSLVVRKPAVWVTEAVRTEDWDTNRTAVDVTLKIKIEGKDYAGRAVYVISRANGKMLLSEVPVFDVK
ncbi:MAG TPA: tetratricopeptide repeat protein [Blastocatellia bacterium]|nr:tetratricopeptide repeat protein [Blastocatellia bacterium]HMY74648.1 tetratricopeptide repeat protein [Blastocatellia bacterium]HNG30686.1 tetratricopeptide repeat protein [Blastocatellia bacterium]